MPIYKSGDSVFVTDDNGNILHEEKGGKTYRLPTGQVIPTSADGTIIAKENYNKIPKIAPSMSGTAVSPNSPADKAHSFLDEYVRPILPAGVQAGVSALAGPSAGIAAGTATKYGLDKAAGNVYEAPTDVFDNKGDLGKFGNAATEAVANEGFNKATELAGKAVSNLSGRLLPHLYPTDAKILPEDLAAASIDQFPRSVGQLTGNKAAQRMEGKYGGEKLRELANTQRNIRGTQLEKITKDFFAGDSSNPAMQKQLAQNYFNNQDNVDRLYTNFRTNHANKNSITFQQEVPNPKAGQVSAILDANGNKQIEPDTIMQNATVRGPIFLNEASKVADSIRPQLDAFLKGPAYQALPEQSRSKFTQLKNVIDNLSKPTNATYNGQQLNLPVQEWEKLKQWRTDIGKALSTESKLDLPKGQLQRLQQAVGRDVESSVGIWANGDNAIKDLKSANEAHGEFMDTFHDKKNPLVKSLFKGNPSLSKGGENLADSADLFDMKRLGESPDAAQKFMDALGPGHSNMAKSNIISRVFENSTDDATGKFSADKAINTLKGEGYNKIFSSADRSNLENFLRQMRTMRPEDLGTKAIGIGHNGSFLLRFPGVSSAVEVSSRQFAQKVLLNPKYARIAAQLPYKQAGSNEASLLGKSLMVALRGSQVMLNENGQEIPASIDDNGEIKR